VDTELRQCVRARVTVSLVNYGTPSRIEFLRDSRVARFAELEVAGSVQDVHPDGRSVDVVVSTVEVLHGCLVRFRELVLQQTSNDGALADSS